MKYILAEPPSEAEIQEWLDDGAQGWFPSQLISDIEIAKILGVDAIITLPKEPV